MTELTCRLCGDALSEPFADLGTSPLANALIPAQRLWEAEHFFPLRAYVCTTCFLVQLPPLVSSETLFGDYLYYSSYSDSWVAHAHRFAETAIARLGLDSNSKVIEIASNDGYLLQHFVSREIPALGIEPAEAVAAAAEDKGVRTLVAFLDRPLAERLRAEGETADLLVGNNVLAHVPNLNEFVAALRLLLNPDGMLVMEFPHLVELIRQNQFDTIYHEHFSYFSLHAVQRLFASHELRIVDVEELPTHGGSLRIYACHRDAEHETDDRVAALEQREAAFGITELATYQLFHEQVARTKRELLTFLIEAKAAGKQIAGYGAPAKGNTLLNYCGVGTDFLDYTVDRNPEKQGRYLPGSRIPVHAPERLYETEPDLVMILPWNLKDEIVANHAGIARWDGRFFVPIPRVEVLTP